MIFLGFIAEVKNKNYLEAYKILSQTTVLPGVCGRICPHKKQCEGSCVRGIKGEPISIGALESFVFDQFAKDSSSLQDFYSNSNKNVKANVAIIGGGPAGLTCAAFLAKNGASVTIFEKYDYLGGLLVHGIPEFRLPKSVVKETTDKILKLGINVKYKQELGVNLNLNTLVANYDSIFLGIGANVSSKMGVPGEDLPGVYGGNELLEFNLHPDYRGKVVSVVGGGNVAMDCARTIKRLGAKEVNVIYRRAREQMPAEDYEVQEAINEGINFLFQNNIVKVLGDGKVQQLELIKTKLVQKEGDSRLSPVNVENSNYIIDTDYVVMALGSKPAEYVKNLGLRTTKWGNIEVNENYQTSMPKVFAGGDLAGVKGTVAWAARSGRDAANAICLYLSAIHHT